MSTAAHPSVAYLRSLPAIRERCERIYALGVEGKLDNFEVHEDRIPAVAQFVQEVMADAFPNGLKDVKFHSRWRHFEPDGRDRAAELRASWEGVDELEVARRMIDLAVVSVLLDAGAGAAWKFVEEGTGRTFNRSEGLGVASFHMFRAGAFSSDAAQPHQCDAAALSKVTEDSIRAGFQVDDASNPLVGVAGRASLLQRLGAALADKREFFGREGSDICRPGNLVDYLLARSELQSSGRRRVAMSVLWAAVMEGLQDMWPATRTRLAGANMGDVWPHSKLGSDDGEGGNLVPFHKLSQWMTYSLMEPLSWGGFDVEGMEVMTGLAEYRNGGVLVDLGALTLRDPAAAERAHAPASELVVEWRALTVAMVDRVARAFRERVGASEADLPLVKILEAGTWKAGRVAARSKRADGSPPIRIESDGTVF